MRRFVTCTASAAAARSTVDALTLRAVTRTLLFDQTWQSSMKAMLLVSSDASAKSPRRAPGTVTSTFAVAPRLSFGRSQLVYSNRVSAARFDVLASSGRLWAHPIGWRPSSSV